MYVVCSGRVQRFATDGDKDGTLTNKICDLGHFSENKKEILGKSNREINDSGWIDKP